MFNKGYVLLYNTVKKKNNYKSSFVSAGDIDFYNQNTALSSETAWSYGANV